MLYFKLYTSQNTIFRIGRTDWFDTDEMIHSDTLCSAIIANCASLFGNDKAKELQEAYINGKIKHSSLFYLLEFEKDEKKYTIRFMPKPIGILPPLRDNGTNDDRQNNNHPAKVLSAKWVSEKLFSEISSQFNKQSSWEPESALEKSHFEFNLKKDTTIIDNRFILGKNELDFISKPDIDIPAFLSIQTVRKNQIDRNHMQVALNEDDKGQLFNEINLTLNHINVGKWTIKPQMYFLADIKEMQYEFEASLRLMCDEGIGGERSFGRGRFEGFSIDNWNGIDLSENRIALSLISPVKDDLNEIFFYDSVIRGGWTGHVKRKSVRMISEGSYFKSKKIKGKMVNVKTDSWPFDYDVYQNGIAFLG